MCCCHWDYLVSFSFRLLSYNSSHLEDYSLIFCHPVLLFVFWYCHKRGREERIKKESAAQLVDSEGRIVELDDDPMLAGPSGTGTPAAAVNETERPVSSSRQGTRRDERKERERKEKAALEEQK